MKVSYARYKQMMLEEKRRQSALDACSVRCANIGEIKEKIIDAHQALGDRVKDLNAYLDDISKQGRRQESAIRYKIVRAIIEFARTHNTERLRDASEAVLEAARALIDLLGKEDAQNRDIQTLKRQIARASSVLRQRNRDLAQYVKAARLAGCNCGS